MAKVKQNIQFWGDDFGGLFFPHSYALIVKFWGAPSYADAIFAQDLNDNMLKCILDNTNINVGCGYK
jgi:hypothetical protein